MKYLSVAIVAIALAGCSHGGPGPRVQSMEVIPAEPTVLYAQPSVSAGIGVSDDCGPYKFSDTRCNSYLGAAGGGSN